MMEQVRLPGRGTGVGHAGRGGCWFRARLGVERSKASSGVAFRHAGISSAIHAGGSGSNAEGSPVPSHSQGRGCRDPPTSVLQVRLWTAPRFVSMHDFSAPTLSLKVMLPSWQPTASTPPSGLQAQQSARLGSCKGRAKTKGGGAAPGFRRQRRAGWMAAARGALTAPSRVMIRMVARHVTIQAAYESLVTDAGMGDRTMGNQSRWLTLVLETFFCSGNHRPKSPAVALASTCVTGL